VEPITDTSSSPAPDTKCEREETFLDEGVGSLPLNQRQKVLQPRPFFWQRCGDTFLTDMCLYSHFKSTLNHLDGRPLRELRPAPTQPSEAPHTPEPLAASELAEITDMPELAELAEMIAAYELMGPAAYASQWTDSSL
jgi:hypothetical protein